MNFSKKQKEMTPDADENEIIDLQVAIHVYTPNGTREHAQKHMNTLDETRELVKQNR